MQPVGDGRLTDEEAPGSYAGFGFASGHRISVLFQTLCGNTFYRQVTAVIHTTGPDTIMTANILYRLKMRLLSASAPHFAQWNVGRFTRGSTHFKSIMGS